MCFHLQKSDLVPLKPGIVDETGTIAIIAAGTGLGEAFLYWDCKRYQAIASEGGHADFAPRNAIEIELLSFLLKKSSRVSYEKVLSGSRNFEYL